MFKGKKKIFVGKQEYMKVSIKHISSKIKIFEGKQKHLS